MSPRLEAEAARMRAEQAASRRAQQLAHLAYMRSLDTRTANPNPAPRLRITATQREVLRRMAAGAELHTGTSGFWVTGEPVYRSEQRATVSAMRRRGWLEPVPGTERRYRLTAEGRRVAGCGAT